MANAAGFRCYMAGDPHLVAIERSTKLSAPAAAAADWQIGGEDSTWTDSTSFGWWQQWSGNTAATVTALAGMSGGNRFVNWQAQGTRLWPLFKSIGITSKGVIHVHGPIAITGVLRSKITLYAQTFGGNKGYVLYPDDLVYAQDPASVLCANLLGVLSDNDQMIADNAINSPQRAGVGQIYRWTNGDDNGMIGRTTTLPPRHDEPHRHHRRREFGAHAESKKVQRRGHRARNTSARRAASSSRR